jgi:hypothetical protein
MFALLIVVPMTTPIMLALFATLSIFLGESFKRSTAWTI